MSEITMRLGSQVRKLRHMRQLTQEELAERADLSVSFLSQIERGYKSPTVETISKIADGLQVNLSELFCFEGGLGGSTDQRLQELLLEYTNKIKSLYEG